MLGEIRGKSSAWGYPRRPIIVPQCATADGRDGLETLLLNVMP